MIYELLKSKSSWERISESEKPIVLYGTGNGADMVLDEFEKLGIEISFVAASDGFVRKRTFRNFEVRSISEILKEYPDSLIVLGFATSIPEVMKSIREIAEKAEVIVPVVPVFGKEIFNREFMEKNADALDTVYDLLEDSESKRVYEEMCRFQFTGDLSCLFSIESEREDALKDILKLRGNEHILDLGAYRGDTLMEIEDLFGGFRSAIALEPDRKSFEKLKIYCEEKPHITPLPYAVWNEEREFSFFGGGGRQSTIYGEGKYTVRGVSVDSITDDKEITYIKMDVEGAEKEALEGMKNLLSTQRPALSIAAYHRSDDLITLVPLIKSINPQYKIYLRHHPYIPCWDTNLYCI